MVGAADAGRPAWLQIRGQHGLRTQHTAAGRQSCQHVPSICEIHRTLAPTTMFPMDLPPRLSHAAQIRADQFEIISGPDASPLFVFTERSRSWPVNRTGAKLAPAWRRWEDFVFISTVAYTELPICGNSCLRERSRKRATPCVLASICRSYAASNLLRWIAFWLGV